MYDLIEIYMGQNYVIDTGLTWLDCWKAMVFNNYVADEMAIFICEIGV